MIVRLLEIISVAIVGAVTSVVMGRVLGNWLNREKKP